MRLWFFECNLPTWVPGFRTDAGRCSQLAWLAVLICLNTPTVCCADIFLKGDNYYKNEKESRKWHVIYKIVSEKKYIPAWHK